MIKITKAIKTASIECTVISVSNYSQSESPASPNDDATTVYWAINPIDYYVVDRLKVCLDHISYFFFFFFSKQMTVVDRT